MTARSTCDFYCLYYQRTELCGSYRTVTSVPKWYIRHYLRFVWEYTYINKEYFDSIPKRILGTVINERFPILKNESKGILLSIFSTLIIWILVWWVLLSDNIVSLGSVKNGISVFLVSQASSENEYFHRCA